MGPETTRKGRLKSPRTSPNKEAEWRDGEEGGEEDEEGETN